MNKTASTGVSIVRVDKLWQLSCSQWVPQPVTAVFPFFASAHNLQRLTPDFLRFRLQRSPASSLRTGSLIDYRLRLHGVPVWWRTRIEEWVPLVRFVDVQLRGPFRHWSHLHEFITDASGTLVRDTVVFDVYCRRLYRTPVLGWIESDLRRIFEYRRIQIARIFAAGADGGRLLAGVREPRDSPGGGQPC